MTTYHFIKEELSKSEVSVKPFIRTKKGRLERVKGHTRHVVLGEPFAATLEEQSEWVKKHKKLLEDIKYAFMHGELDEIEARKEIKDKFNMSDKDASTYIQKWKVELPPKKFPSQLREEIRKKFIQGQGYEKTIQELVSKGLFEKYENSGAVKLVNAWQEEFINGITDKLQGEDVQQSKQDLNNKISLLPGSLDALEQSKINALYDIQQGLLKGLYDTYVAVHRVSDITGWWLEANTLLVMTWLADAGKLTGISIPGTKYTTEGAGPTTSVLIPEEQLPKYGDMHHVGSTLGVLSFHPETLQKWAKLTPFQDKEIQKIKKQFFYYKINTANALTRLVFITGIGKVGDKTGIEDLNMILEEWGKNKYKYSKGKKKPTQMRDIEKYAEKKPTDVMFEEPEYLKPEKPKPWKVKGVIEETPLQLKVSQTLLPENLGSLGTGKLGTNPGGTYKDSTTGLKYYVKAYADKQGPFPVDSGVAQAQVEHLANKIYQHLGIATAQTELIYMNDFNKICIASRWIDGAQKAPIEEQAKANDVVRGFVADAYLKNWDVAGMDYENILKDPVTGQLIRSDNGGSMMFRAQGSAKEFENDYLPELDSMRNPKHGAGKIFKGVTDADIKTQAQYLVSTLKEADIDRMVEESGLTGTIREKAINGLKGRRQYLIERYVLTVPAEEQTVFALYEGGTTAMKEGFATVGSKHSAVKGKLVTFPGFEDIQFFQYKNAKGEYGVAELTTGLSTAGTSPTEQQALDKAKEALSKYGLEFTKDQIKKWENKAPQVPHESQIKVWTVPNFKLPNGKVLWEGNWIKYNHANAHNHYKVTTIYANNKIHIKEMDNWGKELQEFDMTITPDIQISTEPKYEGKTPPPSAKMNKEVLERITNVWFRAKELANKYETKEVVPKLKEFNKVLRNCFEENPYVFRAVSGDCFNKSMNQILNEHVLTGSNHVKGTTCMSVSPWSSTPFGNYMFVLDKKKLLENSDWVKPIQYYNYELQSEEPKTFSSDKDSEHDDIYSASYVREMEVRAKHIHNPLSVISEVWIHKVGVSESEKWKIIEETEDNYPQLVGKVRVLDVFKDLKWPKGMAKSLRRYLEKYVILEKAGMRPGLVQVMVDVNGPSGIYRAIRWESPEDAQRMIKEGKAFAAPGQQGAQQPQQEPSKVGEKISVGGKEIEVTAVGRDGVTARDEQGQKHQITHQNVQKEGGKPKEETKSVKAKVKAKSKTKDHPHFEGTISYQEIKSQMDKNLKEIRTESPRIKEVSGSMDTDNAKSIATNMRNELTVYTKYLAGDTVDLMHKFVSLTETTIESLKGIDAKYLSDMCVDSIKKLVHQEIESNRQQFTDHGVRHIVKNILNQKEMLDSLQSSGIVVSPKDRLLAIFVMINHDVGYTTPAIRRGGIEGVKVAKNHEIGRAHV